MHIHLFAVFVDVRIGVWGFYCTLSGFPVEKQHTVKPVLSGHSKIDKTKVLMTNGSLMKVESAAECEHSVILSTCIKLTFFIKTYSWSSFEWPLKTGFTF